MRRRRVIASFTALLVGVAVMMCACGVGSANAQTPAGVSAEEHGCCKTAGDAPAVPARESEACQHCGNLTIVPAKTPHRTADLDLLSFALLHEAPAIIAEPASPPPSITIPLSVPPSDLLSLHCALRL